MRAATLITGATSGLGLALARRLAARGDHPLVLAVRDPGAVDPALRASARVHAVSLDLASLDSVRGFPERLRASGAPAIGTIVCNAGIQHVSARHTSRDGYEATFATNHLGHYLLVRLLVPGPARVIVVSSTTHDPDRWTGMKHAPFAEPRTVALREPARGQSLWEFGQIAYTTSKLYNVLFAYELARRVPGLRVDAYDSGAMTGTRLVRDWPAWLQRFLRIAGPVLARMPGFSTLARSSAFLERLVTDPALAARSGRYFSIDQETRSSRESYDLDYQRIAWDGSAELVGLHAPAAATATP